jgi:oxygen-independent coproporphyrinogen-3 oxidase
MEHLSQLRRLGLFDSKVPRYTSYPPATKFSNDVTGDVFRTWVERIPPGSAISVYLHVPFCRRLCWFCACRTQGTRTDAPVIAYVETLRQEIANLKAILPEGVRIARLHWGGGTPTLMHPTRCASSLMPSPTPCRWPTAPNSPSRSTPTRSTNPA